MEIQGVDTKHSEDFPYSGLRVLGGVQTGIGCTCVVLGILDLALTLTSRDADLQIYTAASGLRTVYEVISTLVISSCPIWCGMWFIICGSIGTCVSRVRAHSLLFFRNTILTLSMLCAILFGPACMGITGYEAMVRHALTSTDYKWLLPTVVCFLALFEIILAVISAAICCCCSPVQLTKVHVLIAEPPSRKFQKDVLQSKPAESDWREAPYKMPSNGQDRRPPSPSPSPEVTERPLQKFREHLAPANDYMKTPRADSYLKLKHWAVPND